MKRSCYRRTPEELTKDWVNLREGVDSALKYLGMLPSAIATQDETDRIDEVIGRLSNELCYIDDLLGDLEPLDKDDPRRMPWQTPEAAE